MQFKGLGVPNQYFAEQNEQMYIRLHCLLVLWNLSTCFPNLKIILQIRPSVFKFNLKRTVIFCKKNFSHLQPPQAGRVGTNSQFFESVFYKSDFKNTCWASPKPNIQHKIVLAVRPRWDWISKFSWRKNYFRKIDIDSFNIASNRSYTSGFEGKKRKHPFQFFLGILLKSTENRKHYFRFFTPQNRRYDLLKNLL